MRFLVVNTDYLPFLNKFYNSDPDLINAPWEKQLAARHETLFGMNNFRSLNLKKLGHEAVDIYFNNKTMQFAWLKKYQPLFNAETAAFYESLKQSGLPWDYFTLAVQIMYYRPDVLMNDAMGDIDTDVLKQLKPLVGLLAGCGEPPVLLNNKNYEIYDLVLSPSPFMLDHFKQRDINSELFLFAFESTLINKIKSSAKRSGISFIGSLGNAHKNRIELLETILSKHEMDIYAPEIGEINPASPILKSYKGSSFGKSMYSVLGSTSITLNNHINIAGNYADNMRLFEATGMGSLLITDAKINLDSIFKIGTEVIAYNSPEECSEMVSYFMEHEKERNKIAAEGQNKTLAKHSYFKRMQQLVELSKVYIDKKYTTTASVNIKPEEGEVISAKDDLSNVLQIANQKRYGKFTVHFRGLKIHCVDLLSFYMAAKDIFLQGIYDFESSTASPNVIDGGGHIGLFTLYTKSKYPGAVITVFEPEVESYDLLHKNIAANKLSNITVVKAGLLDRETELTFSPDGSDGSTLFSSEGNVKIKVVPLSRYLTKEVDFLKLNIEGAETQVIEEIKSKLNLVKEIVIEYHGFPELGQHLHSILGNLNNAGYRYFINDFDTLTNPATKPPFRINKDTRFFLLIYAKRLFEAVVNNLSLNPVSRSFGFDRGTPIDRYYINKFLSGCSEKITGNVLEIAEDVYTRQFGTNITKSDVLSFENGNGVTLVGNLETGENIPANEFDCIILTQTLQMIYDIKKALSHAYNALKPGGSLLLTISGISQISRYDMDRWGEYWRLTTKSLENLLNDLVNSEFEITSYGNVASAKAFLDGLCCEELTAEILDFNDQDYQLILTASVKKREKVSTVLLYHRIADDPLDSQLLTVSAENFDAQLAILKERYSIVPLSECLNNLTGENLIALSFDDGYADNLLNALPILEKHKAHATIFITSGMIDSDHEFWWDDLEKLLLSRFNTKKKLEFSANGIDFTWDLSNPSGRFTAYNDIQRLLYPLSLEDKKNFLSQLHIWSGINHQARADHRILTKEQLLKLSASPYIEIGSHTVNHARLSSLTYEQQYLELKESKKALESIIGKEVRIISYPFGTESDINKDTVKASKAAGYKYGIANINGDLSENADLFMVPRRLVRNWDKITFNEWIASGNKMKFENDAIKSRPSSYNEYFYNSI